MPSCRSLPVVALAVALAACGAPPELGATEQLALTSSPISATVGNVVVGTTSAAVTTRVYHTGLQNQGDVVVAVLESCPEFTYNLGGQSLPWDVYRIDIPGDPLEIQEFILPVTFTPTARGLRSCTVTIDMQTAADRTFTVTGTGIAPELTVTPASLGFGAQRVNTTSAAQPVTISNTGDAGQTLNLSALTLTGGQFVIAGPGSMSIAPGGSQTVNVSFRPTAPGAQADALRIVGNDPVDVDELVALSGTGVQSLAALSPATLVFPGTPSGGSSSADATLSNPGNATLSVSGVTITGPNASEFLVTSATTFTVGGGASAPITVRCSPTSTGTKTATLTATTDADGPPQNPSIGLSCPAVAPDISVGATALDFGSVQVGSPASRTFSITNGGGAALIGTVARTGGAAADFAVSPPSINLGPGQSTTVTVTFTPSVNGARSTTVVIASNDPDSPMVTVAASGVGTTVDVIQTSPIGGTLAFGGVPVNAASAASTVEVRNAGNVPITISGAGLIGANATDFEIVTGPASISLAAGELATWTLVCRPASAGPKVATFQYPNNDPAGPSSVGLTCTGLVTSISITPASPVSFGTVRVGQLSAAVPITLRNTGNAPVAVNAVAISAAAFEVVAPLTPAAPTTLEPNAIATMSVVFHPSTEGTAQADLTVTYDGTQTVAFTLSGNAVVPRATAAPSTLAFGPVCLGQPRTLALTVGNSAGTGPFQITAATSSNPVFTVTPQAPTTVPGVVGAGAEVILDVRADLTDSSDQTGTITVTTDVPSVTLTIPVSASGLAGGIGIGPAETDFGMVEVGQPGPSRTVTLTNCSAAGITLASLELGGADRADFAITDAPPLPATVAAAASAQFVLGFAPTRVGLEAATLTVGHDGAGSPTTATLVGTGAAGPSVDAGNGSGVTDTSFYACSAGGAAGAAPLGLALLGVAVRRRRRR